MGDRCLVMVDELSNFSSSLSECLFDSDLLLYTIPLTFLFMYTPVLLQRSGTPQALRGWITETNRCSWKNQNAAPSRRPHQLPCNA